MSLAISNILIRGLTDKDRETLEVVMNETGCRQASKAVIQAMYSFQRSQILTKQQSKRIKELEIENQILRQNAVLITQSVNRLNGLLLSKKK